MVAAPDIARLEAPHVRVAHCRLPSWSNEEVNSVSQPGSIGMSFTHQPDATIRRGNGRADRRDVPPGSVGLGGQEPIAWLAVGSASEIIEITASEALRRDIAEELRAPHHAQLDDLHGWTDPVIKAVMLRFRAGVRGWMPLDGMEQEALTRAAYARVLQLKFGATARAARNLDSIRLARVVDFISANLDRHLSIAELAEVATLSAYHFAHSFKQTTGLAPHRYVTTLRLDRVMDRLTHSPTTTVEKVAAEIGMSNLNHFRRLFRAQFGGPPSLVRR